MSLMYTIDIYSHGKKEINLDFPTANLPYPGSFNRFTNRLDTVFFAHLCMLYFYQGFSHALA